MVKAAAFDCARRGVAGRVHFVGRQPDPRPYLVAGDVFALPSAYEAYPLVVLEALACGLPVVATPVGSVPDLIGDGNGRVVSRNVPAIREALAELADADRAAAAAQARETALDHSWPRVADEYLRLVEEILTGRSR